MIKSLSEVFERVWIGYDFFIVFSCGI